MFSKEDRNLSFSVKNKESVMGRVKTKARLDADQDGSRRRNGYTPYPKKIRHRKGKR